MHPKSLDNPMHTQHRLIFGSMLSILILIGCAQPVDPNATNEDDSSEPQHQEMEQVKAESGVGIRGRATEGGLISQPVSSYFKARQSLVFGQVTQALELHKALEGQYPKSQEEFMDKIVKANNLKLPELPEGHQYLYKPESGELMVERPVGE